MMLNRVSVNTFARRVRGPLERLESCHSSLSAGGVVGLHLIEET